MPDRMSSSAWPAVGNTTIRTDMAPEIKAHESVPPAAGALIQQQTYDSYNRIRTVVNGTTNETMGQYFYDDSGFRVRQIAKHKDSGAGPNVDRVYEVEAANKYFAVEKQKDLSGTVIANTTYSVNNIYLDGVRIASVVPTGQARYFLTDQVDSVNVVTNDAGQPITRTEYLPYGETWFMEGDKNYAPKFNSQQLDKESNFYFMNARHYDPELARFVTADSIVDGEDSVKGWNRYMYVGGNPVMYKDPTGHCVGCTQTLVNGLKAIGNWFKGEKKDSYAQDVVKTSGGATKARVEGQLQKAPVYRAALENGGVSKLPLPLKNDNFATNRQGINPNPIHTGLDQGASTGTLLPAVHEGTVEKVEDTEQTIGPGKGYGKYIQIKHTNGLVSITAHNSKTFVTEGDKVSEGDAISESGATGNVTGPHVHFELRRSAIIQEYKIGKNGERINLKAKESYINISPAKTDWNADYNTPITVDKLVK